MTGIIDPTKVVRVGLENAVSVASVLFLTKATLTEVPKTKRALRHTERGGYGVALAAQDLGREKQFAQSEVARG